MGQTLFDTEPPSRLPEEVCDPLHAQPGVPCPGPTTYVWQPDAEDVSGKFNTRKMRYTANLQNIVTINNSDLKVSNCNCDVIGEWEQANLVVQLAPFFCI